MKKLLLLVSESRRKRFASSLLWRQVEFLNALGGNAQLNRCLTITSKFGIEPPPRTNALRFALHTGRRLAQLVPAVRKVAQRQTAVRIKGGAFSVDDAQKNLETSLRELGTDYIDFYLLNDYLVGDSAPHELVAFLRGAVKAGKIRYFSMGTDINSVVRALERRFDICNVMQFQNSLFTQNQQKLPSHAIRGLIITHGALAEPYRRVLSFLKANSKTVNNWSAELGLDCSNDGTIAALMLNYAVEANPRGLVLFSSRNQLRITRNTKSEIEPSISSL